MTETVLDRLILRLTESLAFTANANVPPIALLWPDGHSQWEPVINRIAERLPVLRLGSYNPELKGGPAYWLRCVVAGTVEAETLDGTPIVYLPAVPRSELRAIEDCPAELAPIAELQYRSQWFSHPNGKDWTVRSLLSHPDRGLGLTVMDNTETNSALLLALDRLLELPIERLKTHTLDAQFFHDLINPNPIRSLLGWIDDPAGFRQRLDGAQWSAFLQQSIADYGFDPASDGEITAARKLAEREGRWTHVWKEYAEAPDRYPGIPERIRQAKPMRFTFEHSDAWPQDNESAEDQLRTSLLSFASLTAAEARARGRAS